MFWVYVTLGYLIAGYIVAVIYSTLCKLTYDKGKRVFEDGDMVPPALIVPFWPFAVIFGFFVGAALMLTSVIRVISDKLVDLIKGK